MRAVIAVPILLFAGVARAEDIEDLLIRDLCARKSHPTDYNGDPLPCPDDVRVTNSEPPHVQAFDSDPPPPAPAKVRGIDYELRPRWQGGLGVRFGSLRIDGVDADYKVGVVLAGGVHLDRLAVLGEYALAGVAYHGAGGAAAALGSAVPTSDTDGIAHRLGIAARYAIAKASSVAEVGEPQVIGELWLEAGAGEQLVQWDKGGLLERPEFTLGVGMQTSARTKALHRGGMSISFRVGFARRTDLDGAAATCSAPCTQATPPAAWSDRSYALDLTYVFGG